MARTSTRSSRALVILSADHLCLSERRRAAKESGVAEGWWVRSPTGWGAADQRERRSLGGQASVAAGRCHSERRSPLPLRTAARREGIWGCGGVVSQVAHRMVARLTLAGRFLRIVDPNKHP